MDSPRRLLYRAYWKAEAAIVPGLTSSQYGYYKKLRSLIPDKTWLDLGCGHQVFADWMTNEQAEIIASCRTAYGIDLDWTGLKAHPAISNKVFGDLAHLPFEAECVDVVSANMVAEHLADPEPVLREIHRVLKPNGVFVFHTPNRRGWPTRMAARIPDGLKKKLIWLLERRREEDVFPTHYRMNSSSAIAKLAAETGFTVEDITAVSTSAATAMLGPVALVELLYIRYLQRPQGAEFRSNLVAALQKRSIR
ncbi:MAG: class I SAM-dependent methyltransferase [Bryobacteraceae bacterium]